MNDDLRDQGRRMAIEVGIFAGIFLLASLVGALIWKAVTDLPQWTQAGSGQGVILAYPVEATKTFGIDATYLFVSVPIALVLGLVLTYWRRRTPVTTVVLIAVVSVCAAALMERFGLWLGPPDPTHVLAAAKIGADAPVRLQVQATGVILAWPAAAVLGSLIVLLATPPDKFEPTALPGHEIPGEVSSSAN